MKKIKSIVLFVLILFLISRPNISNSIDTETLFNKIKQKNSRYLPNSFTARVLGHSINTSLKKIPRKSYRGRPYVKFLFHKKYGERIIVKNVEEIYKDRFAIYLNMYNDFKIFLKKDKSYVGFINKHEWKVISTNYHSYIIRMRKKITRRSNFFKIFINKRTLQITQVINYKNSRQTGRYIISYAYKSGYRVISRLSFLGMINKKYHRITFYFRNIKINPSLSEEDFLN